MDFLCRDNIIAEITPVGKGAVSAIRISGKDSKSIVEHSFDFKINRPRTACFLRTSIDDLIIVYYKAPSSYTGEDVCEIFCHGNPIIVDGIMNTLLSAENYSVRLAKPGEFTKRAYINNKMDLVQAEAVNQLINSSNQRSLSARKRALKGGLSEKLKDIKAKLLNISSLAELEIDFEEERAGLFDTKKALGEIDHLINDVKELVKGSERAEKESKTMRVAFVGETNVGKSSIFNRIVGKRRSIVNEMPGTTRDYIESDIRLSDLDVVMIDTAGFRGSPKDKVEEEGIGFSESLAKDLFLVVEICESDDYLFRYDRAIKVRNKIDINNIKNRKNSVLYISAKTGEGVEELIKAISDRLREDMKLDETREADFMLSKRQGELIKEILSSIESVKLSLTSGQELDGISYMLKHCLSVINKVLGEEPVKDEVLDELFSNFCIGK